MAKLDDLDQLAAHIDAFMHGHCSADGLQRKRVPMGVYEQRRAGAFMIRMRCPGGSIEPAQLRTVTEIGGRYSGRLHVTTRQELQIHDLELRHVMPTLRELARADLATKGTGGNTVRNITASAASGLGPNEIVDVTACARLLTKRLVAEPEAFGLPRKFKVAFAADAGDDVGARFNDLGFVAAHAGGVTGFQVYVAGGLGTRPRAADLLHEFIPAKDTFDVALAVLRLFSKLGDRDNRQAARLRFLWARLGSEEFRNRYYRELEQVRLERLPRFVVPIAAPTARVPDDSVPMPVSDSEAIWRKRYVNSQADPALFSVLVPLASGDLDLLAAEAIAEFAQAQGTDALRFTTSQNVLLRHVPRRRLSELYSILSARLPLVHVPTVVANCVACAGPATCQLGICLSKNALAAIQDALVTSAAPSLDAAADMRIQLSGCPNNCGRHLLADLGLYGRAMRTDSGLYPAYGVVAGARSGSGARLAEPLGTVVARRVPELVTAVVRAFATGRVEAQSFAAWYDQAGRDEVQRLVRALSGRPTGDNAELLVDWGSDRAFSLADRGEGECAAGE